MKNYFKLLSLFCVAILFTNCSSDDDNTTSAELEGEGNIEIFFDNSFNNDDLLLGASTYVNSLGETFKVNRMSYIVSNFSLTDEDGNVFTYPEEDSYFIISEEDQEVKVELQNVPAGNYTSMKFGIGVPMEKYVQGETSQQEFWDFAATKNMTWAWIVGYKFMNFEGDFTSDELDDMHDFKIHVGSHGEALDNYREVELSFPRTAQVRTDRTPDVHLVADANKILDGTNKFELTPLLNDAGASQIMVDAERAPLVADNFMEMFYVDHIHSNTSH